MLSVWPLPAALTPLAVIGVLPRLRSGRSSRTQPSSHATTGWPDGVKSTEIAREGVPVCR